MPVDSRHPEYARNLRRWVIARAVCEGEDAVKDVGSSSVSSREFGVSPTSPTGSEPSQTLAAALGATGALGTLGGQATGISWMVLPPLSGHTTYEEYWRYVQHAHFFPGASRAREGMVGLLVKDEVAVVAPDSMSEFTADVTSSGSPQGVDEFVSQALYEIMTTGRCGVLTDYPPRPRGSDGRESGVPNQRDAELLGIKPMWRLFTAEQIINWRMDKVRGREILGLVVVEENTVIAPDAAALDEFAWIPVRQWRVLDRAMPPAELAGKVPQETMAGDQKVYRVRFFTVGQDGSFVVSQDIWPLVNGKLSEEIPFEFIGARDCTPKCDKPPLYDVITVNVGHYRNSAALEHALFFCANPMGYIFGYDPEEEMEAQELERPGASRTPPKWVMGSSRMLVLKNKDAKAGVLSATAESVSALSERIEVKRLEMAALVGRLLATEKNVAEAQGTEKIRRQGEQGVLSSIAGNVSDALTRCLCRARDYMGIKGEVSVSVPTQFWDSGITAAEATAIADLWMKYKLIAKSDVRQQLRDSGFVTRSDEDIDEELDSEGVPAAPPDFLPAPNGAGAGAVPVPPPAGAPPPGPPPTVKPPQKAPATGT